MTLEATAAVPVEETPAVDRSHLRNEPRQARSVARLERILEAARVHYAEAGRDRFSTASVATLAGCSIGTVYRYFDDGVAILDEIEPKRDEAANQLAAVRAILATVQTSEYKLIAIERALAV